MQSVAGTHACTVPTRQKHSKRIGCNPAACRYAPVLNGELLQTALEGRQLLRHDLGLHRVHVLPQRLVLILFGMHTSSSLAACPNEQPVKLRRTQVDQERLVSFRSGD